MSDGNDDLAAIRRQPAQSGRLDYSEPSVLHDTTQKRLTLVPFYIPRTQGTDLSVKIVEERPSGKWGDKPKEISLDAAATGKLLAALRQYSVVSGAGREGDYLAIRVSDGNTELTGHDPASVARALISVLGQPGIAEHLTPGNLDQGFATAVRGAIRLQGMQTAVSELRGALDGGESDERVYQEWCERHTWAFGNAYVMRDDVREITTGDTLDLLLKQVLSGFRDLVELKRPDMDVLFCDKKHRNYYFASETSKAIGQCHRYLDHLHRYAEEGLLDHKEIVAYHPRAMIVIGRSIDWPDEQLKALHGLNSRLSGITVMTYDHLLAQGERLVEMLTLDENGSEGDSPNQASEDTHPWADR